MCAELRVGPPMPIVVTFARRRPVHNNAPNSFPQFEELLCGNSVSAVLQSVGEQWVLGVLAFPFTLFVDTS